MSRLAHPLTQTDRRIRELTQQIDLYRNRVARRFKNPALAEQATRLLPAMSAQLGELTRYRKRLLRAVEIETILSPQDEDVGRRYPGIPRHIR
jgi:hypothetical protein